LPIKKYFRSFVFAFAGIAYAFRSQFNMRFHIVTAFIVVSAAAYFRISLAEWCVILLCIGSVISAELINTSIEYSVDLAMPDRNEKAGQAKDMAAAAVLVVSGVSAIIGLIVFVPRFIQLF
jgi:undecaprenol kinase